MLGVVARYDSGLSSRTSRRGAHNHIEAVPASGRFWIPRSDQNHDPRIPPHLSAGKSAHIAVRRPAFVIWSQRGRHNSVSDTETEAAANRISTKMPRYFGARVTNRARTGDIQNHNLALYQLSYSHRNWFCGLYRNRIVLQASKIETTGDQIAQQGRSSPAIRFNCTQNPEVVPSARLTTAAMSFDAVFLIVSVREPVHGLAQIHSHWWRTHSSFLIYMSHPSHRSHKSNYFQPVPIAVTEIQVDPAFRSPVPGRRPKYDALPVPAHTESSPGQPSAMQYC
jgi:hypothetical protein